MTDLATQFEAQLAERQAAARKLEENSAEARRLASVNEDLRLDSERCEARIRAFRALGKEHLERKQEE